MECECGLEANTIEELKKKHEEREETCASVIADMEMSK